MHSLFVRGAPRSLFWAGALLLIAVLTVPPPAQAQTFRVQNGTTVQVSNGTTLNLEGGTMDLGDAGATARLDEQGEGRVSGGLLTAVRALNGPSAVNVAGLGAEITASADLGNVTVRRGHVEHTLPNGNPSIKRYFDIEPGGTNSGLSATLAFHYADAELNGLSESSLELFRSSDGGSSWTADGQNSRDTNADVVQLNGIRSFSRWTLGGEQGVTAPQALSADLSSGDIELTWDAVSASDLRTYRVYRDTIPIGSTSPSALTPVDSVAPSTTSYTDTGLDAGHTYYYRVTAVSTSGNESAFSPTASALLYPASIAMNATRSFGDASGPADYRLVALPGAVNRPVGEAVGGEAGREWQAYWDDGSSFVRFDGSDTFTFRAGRGFWLTSRQDWTVEDQFSTVALRSDTSAAIAVNDGWTIVSNPFGKPVDWSTVEAANGGDLPPLWAFGGAFDSTTTFASATTGKAYYFFNDDASRDSLKVPYPGTSTAKDRPTSKRTPAPMPALSATPKQTGHPVSTVHIGLTDGNAESDRLRAPPGRFEAVSLRVEARQDGQGTDPLLLMAQRRILEGRGETFTLRLTNRTKEPVQLKAQNLAAVKNQEVALLDPSAARSYDVRAESPITLSPGDDGQTLKVAIGSERYVNNQKEQIVPNEVRLRSYPNPVRGQGTIEYTLPESQEVTLRVYDVLGREVATLVDGRKDAGRHRTRLKTDQMASGVYFGRLMVGRQTRTQKITVVR